MWKGNVKKCYIFKKSNFNHHIQGEFKRTVWLSQYPRIILQISEVAYWFPADSKFRASVFSVWKVRQYQVNILYVLEKPDFLI